MREKKRLLRGAAALCALLLCGGIAVSAAHTHQFGGWEYEDRQNHLGYCLVSGCRETCLEPHSYVEDASAYVAPTEEQDGRRALVCAQCNDLVVETIPKLPHTTHDYDSVYVSPTCTEAGYREYTCSVCGFRYTEPGEAALGHSFSVRVATTAPTCVSDGCTVYRCVRCAATAQRDAVPALGHDFGDWVVTTAPTVQTQGEETRVCARCGAAETRAVPQTVPGDVDGSGTVNLRDVTALRRFLTGWGVTVVSANCDVNGDGQVDLTDAARILRWLAGGWDVELR